MTSGDPLKRLAELGSRGPVCLSGGAAGADLEWGYAAAKAGHGVVHFVFQGHRSRVVQEERHVLDHAQLSLADPALREANRSLRRRYPTSSLFVNSLLQRNYYQVYQADACYAVSRIDSRGLVEGGTAWAVQMMLDLHPERPCHVYCQRESAWFTWDGAWQKLTGQPPAPGGLWAGVGSRELSPAGTRAIRELLGGAV